MRLRTLLLSALIVVSMSVVALGADDLEGTLTVNGKDVPVRHIRALLHDNAEGILSSPTHLRLLFTDVEVPIDSLYGLRFMRAREWQSSVNGILLQFDPASYGAIDITMLLPNGRQTVTSKVKVRDLKLTREQVSGMVEYEDRDSFGTTSSDITPVVKFSFRFTATLHHPPAVTADLKGRDALNSPQVRALRVIANTIAAGDLTALEKLTSKTAARRNSEEIERRGKDAKKFYMRIGSEIKKLIPGVKRVVVRGDHAVIILPENGTYELVLDGNAWKGN